MRLEVASVDIDVQAHLDRARDDGLWLFAARKWHALYGPWVPYDTGALYNVVEFAPGEVSHLVSYAQKVYEGDFNYHRDVHPFASRQWDMAAAPTQLPHLIDAMQTYVDGGTLGPSSGR